MTTRIKEEDYETLDGFISCGTDTLAIRIQIAGSKLPNLKGEKINGAAYAALDILKEEVTAALNAEDPVSQERAKAEKTAILGCFDEPIYVEEIPNGYCSRACCRHLPWFVVTTQIGRIKIGWRKRVISIEWEGTRAGDAETLFPNENVTKMDKLIHAWGLEDAKKYVNRIIQSGLDNLQ